MKQVIAYVKPHVLSDVALALRQIGNLRGMSVTKIEGFGRRESTDRHYPVDDLMDFAPYLRIEIFCYNDLADEVVSAIDRTAKTGLRGDGKIYVIDVEKAFKVGKGQID